MDLYWEPKNFGRIACEKHVGGSAGPEDRLSQDDIDFYRAMGDEDILKCEDC